MSGTTEKAERRTRPSDLPTIRFAWSNAGGQGEVGDDTEQLVVKHTLGTVLNAIERVRQATGPKVWQRVVEYLEARNDG